MRNFILGFITCYLCVGLAAGLAMKRMLPPLTYAGVAYVGLSWPVSLVCIASKHDCSPVPSPDHAKWMFAFDQ